MVKRLISATPSEVAKMNGEELKQAIKASEGRTICVENVVGAMPQAGDLTNAEVAKAFGIDARTAAKRYQIGKENSISLATLARYLSR